MAFESPRSVLAAPERGASHEMGASPAGQPQEIIRFDEVSFRFGSGVEIAHRLSFAIREGEFITFIGRSGCGKSTILNLSAGLLSPTGGAVLFQGQPIIDVNTAVGYMTQDDTLLPWCTIAANIGLPLKLRKHPAFEIKEKVELYAEMLDLSAALGMYPSQLSGGMKRRALLARSLIYDPRILLLDEPFAALDASLRDDLHVQLRETVEKLHQTVLFITHDISEAAVLSDRVVVLGGRPLEIRDDYDVPFLRNRDVRKVRTQSDFMDLQRTLRLALDRAQQPLNVGDA